MSLNSIEEKKFIESYNPNEYDKVSLATDIVALSIYSGEKLNHRRLPEKKLSVLLVKRGEHPYKGNWALPGGFVGLEETLDECSERKLYEKTNLNDVYMEQLYTFSGVNRDPRIRIICTAYIALLPEQVDCVAVKSEETDCWFNISLVEEAIETRKEKDFIKSRKTYSLKLESDDVTLFAQVAKVVEFIGNRRKEYYEIISSDELAFDHAEIIMCALDRLKGKVEYTDIAFNLLKDTFTLKALQDVHELILERSLLAGNFRKKIVDAVVETSLVERSGQRNAKLYKRKLEV